MKYKLTVYSCYPPTPAFSEVFDIDNSSFKSDEEIKEYLLEKYNNRFIANYVGATLKKLDRG